MSIAEKIYVVLKVLLILMWFAVMFFPMGGLARVILR